MLNDSKSSDTVHFEEAIVQAQFERLNPLERFYIVTEINNRSLNLLVAEAEAFNKSKKWWQRKKQINYTLVANLQMPPFIIGKTETSDSVLEYVFSKHVEKYKQEKGNK